MYETKPSLKVIYRYILPILIFSVIIFFVSACDKSPALKIKYTTSNTQTNDSGTSIINTTSKDETTSETDTSTDELTTDSITTNKTETTTNIIETTTKEPPTTTKEPTTTQPPTTQPPTQPPTTQPPTNEPTTNPPEKPSYVISLNKISSPLTEVISKNGYDIDISNKKYGYFTVRGNTTDKEIRVLVYFNGSSNPNQYLFTADNKFHAYTLTRGSGTYRIRIMVNNGETSATGQKLYLEKCAYEGSITLINNTTAFVYPNVAVKYNEKTAAIIKGYELTAGLTNDSKKVDAIYNWIIKNIAYDKAKAASITSGVVTGYIPSVDTTYSTKKGICSDYSVLFAAMLRAQKIPAKVVYGFTSKGKEYHAWNEVYYSGSWHTLDTTYGVANLTGIKYTVDKYFY